MMFCEAVVEQLVVVLVVTRVTVLMPAVLYTTPLGFCEVEVVGLAPVPKSHNQLTPVVVPMLLKLTGKPVHCGAVDVKSARGVSLITMVCTEVCVQF